MAENGCGKVADGSEQFCPWLRHVLDNYSVMTAAISVTISQTISSKKTLVLNGTYFYEAHPPGPRLIFVAPEGAHPQGLRVPL